MIRTEIIQRLIDKSKTTSYLEIGVGPGLNFQTIQCLEKVCVDPNPTTAVTYELTSDDFFAMNTSKFGVIFIDGLHWSEQVYRDIENSLKILEPGGFIVCHDMNPHSELIQRYPQPIPNSEWTGDCWKAWVKLRSERSDLEMYVVDTDYGCGVISKGKQKVIKLSEELEWDYFNKQRNYLLNLISIQEFIDKIDITNG